MVYRGVYRGLHGGVWRIVRRCASVQRFVEVHRGVCGCVWRGAQRCMEVHGGVYGGVWRGLPLVAPSEFEVLSHILRSYTHYRCQIVSEFKVPSFSVLGYHLLPLATIDLVGDNREFEV